MSGVNYQLLNCFDRLMFTSFYLLRYDTHRYAPL